VTPAIVALHGFLGNSHDWDAVRAAVKSSARWVCPDLFAPGAENFLVAPELSEKAWLVGYSFGARLALRWLTEQSDRWYGALLLSVNPGNFQTDAERLERRQSDLRWGEDFRGQPWDVLMTRWNAQEIFSNGEHPRRDEREFDRSKLASAFENFSVAGQFTDMERLTGHYIWMAGEKDTKFRQLLDAMRNTGFPGSFYAVPDAGHRLLHEAPEAVAAALDQLIANE
jgi:2-succinyl-6-hydroxy-2,4-cyclohexadiene-1-carboxylate synthase